MSLTNSTVSGNGSSSTVGGGLVNRAGTLSLLNVTVNENLRGGLETAQGRHHSVQNTILGRGYSDGNNGSCVGAGQTTSNGWTTAAPITSDLGNNLADDLTCGNLTGPQPGRDRRQARPGSRQHGRHPDRRAAAQQPRDRRRQRQRVPADRPARRHAHGAGRALRHRGVRGDQARPAGGHVRVRERDRLHSTPRSSATIDLTGEAGALLFRWGTSPTDLNTFTELVAAGVVSDPTPVTVPVYGLQPRTTYYFQAVADNASDEAAGTIEQFTTLPGPPVVSNLEVTAVTDTTATLGFSIDPVGSGHSYVISINGQATAPVHIGSASGPQQLTHTLAGLTPGTDYTVDVLATNAGGTQGADSGAIPLTTDRQLTEAAGSSVTLTDTGLAPPNARRPRRSTGAMARRPTPRAR